MHGLAGRGIAPTQKIANRRANLSANVDLIDSFGSVDSFTPIAFSLSGLNSSQRIRQNLYLPESVIPACF